MDFDSFYFKFVMYMDDDTTTIIIIIIIIKYLLKIRFHSFEVEPIFLLLKTLYVVGGIYYQKLL